PDETREVDAARARRDEFAADARGDAVLHVDVAAFYCEERFVFIAEHVLDAAGGRFRARHPDDRVCVDAARFERFERLGVAGVLAAFAYFARVHLGEDEQAEAGVAARLDGRRAVGWAGQALAGLDLWALFGVCLE